MGGQMLLQRKALSNFLDWYLCFRRQSHLLWTKEGKGGCKQFKWRGEDGLNNSMTATTWYVEKVMFVPHSCSKGLLPSEKFSALDSSL